MPYQKAMPPALPEVVERIITQFSLLHPVSTAFKKDIYKRVAQLQLKKGSFLLREGMICDYVYFIHKGIIRGFSGKRNQELTTWISVEGDFVTSISGMYGKLSKESMQVIESSVIAAVPVAVLLRWYEEFPEMNVIMRKILESYYQEAQERSYIIRIGTATEKYEYFMETKPGQIDKVPLSCIASFLGIKTETLQRIRDSKKTPGNDSDIQALVNTIEKSIVTGELFKIKGFTVPQLAAMLSLPAHTLSAILNKHYKKSFPDFINGYRISFVKKQLKQNRGWKKNKVEAIGLEAGFASRSAFFAAFRKQEGVTPAAYADQLS
jgi:AraC-like DNA-binding protein